MSNVTDLWLSGVFFQALNTPKLIFGWGRAPDPPAGAYDAPTDHLVGWGGDIPSPFPFPFDAFGRLDLGAFGAWVARPPTQFLAGYAYEYFPVRFLAPVRP